MIKSKDMNIQINDDIKSRFLSGECTGEELSQLRAWMKANLEEAHELFGMERLYDELKAQAMPEEKILLAEHKLTESIEAMQAEQRHAHIVRMWRRAAAIVVVCVLTGMAWMYLQHRAFFKPEMVVAMASAEKDTTVTLPDGTKVWLNKLSSIQYAKDFEGDERKVHLDGEGYFEVTKNPHKPFIVESEVMSVRVLGTIFNFKVEKALQRAAVSLLQGEVRVAGNHNEGMMVLSPGQKACVDAKTGKMTLSEVDVYQDALWHEHKTAFHNESIRGIARILERIYHVQVIVDPAISQSSTYSGIIKEKETIDSVLALLKNTLPIRYKVKGNKVYLSH